MSETFQVSAEAAEIYESRFVPAIFAEWAHRLVEAADVRPGQAVLDVACGTGIVARTAADRIGADGVIVGVDLNPAMLAVARRIRPDLDWQHGDAGALPLPGGAFDTVLCQMALMFFPDRTRALAEMARVAATEGTVALVVPAAIDDQPAYLRLMRIVADEAGADAAAMLNTYWSCGNLSELREIVTDAGLRIRTIRTDVGTARFDSSDDLVATEINGSPLAGQVPPGVYERISGRAREALHEFNDADGTLAAPLVGHVVVARPARR